jgi:D-alanyl-D-alanine carboxypeptidase
MLIPATISFLISVLIFNSLSAVMPGAFLPSAGMVLGAEEQRINTEESLVGLEEVVAKMVDETRKLSAVNLPQLPQLDQPIKRLPISLEKITAVIIDGIETDAENVAAMDCQSGDMIFTKRIDQPRSIASITKLMTALVFLDNNPGWEEIYEMRESDRREGGVIHLFTGERVRVKDLFYTSLVGSGNTATIALVHSTGISEQEFVEKMNQKAQDLGLKNTRFVEASGLHSGNLSTAREVAKLADVAFADSEIATACSTGIYEYKTLNGRRKIIYSTNYLLSSENLKTDHITVLGGKTGYIDAAGYCLVSKFKNTVGGEIITVVLGTGDNGARFEETEKLIKAIYDRL